MMVMLASLVLLATLGFPATRLMSPAAGWRRALGEAFLVGCGIEAAVLAGLTIGHLSWSMAIVLVALVLAAAPLLVAVGFRGGWLPKAKSAHGTFPRFIDFITALCVVGHAVYCTLASLSQFDFWGHWGLEARVFFERRGIDWNFLADRGHGMFHPDYPLLVPLTYDLATILRGTWEDRWLGLFTTAFGAAFLLIARELLAEELESETLGALGTLILVSPALSLWPGMAEAPLAACGCAALLVIRLALRNENQQTLTAGAVFLGLATQCKNEGVALAVAVTIAVLITRGFRTTIRLWPAAAIALPWFAARWMLQLPTDILAGALSRIESNLGHLGELARAIVHEWPDKRLFWLALALVLLIHARRVWREERTTALAILLQIAFYLGSYLVTWWEITAIVTLSWSRLMMQVAPAIAFLAVVVMLAPRTEGSAADTP